MHFCNSKNVKVFLNHITNMQTNSTMYDNQHDGLDEFWNSKNIKVILNRVINMPIDSMMKDNQHDELSSFVKLLGKKKEQKKKFSFGWMVVSLILSSISRLKWYKHCIVCEFGWKVVTYYCHLHTTKKLPKTWMTSLIFFNDSFYKHIIKLKLHKTLIILTCKSFCFLSIVLIIFVRKYNEFGLKRENALLNVSFKNILNLNYHWIVNDQDPRTFEYIVEIVLT